MMLVSILAFTVCAYTLVYTQNCRHWQRDLSLEGKNVLAVRLFATSANAINCSRHCSRDKSCVIYSHYDASNLCLGFSSFATGTYGTNETEVLQYSVFRDGQKSIYTHDILSNKTVFAYGTKKTWQDASNVCHNDGGRLVSLETLEKRRRIVDVLDMKSLHYVGLSDAVVESKWLWESGNTFDLSSETNFLFNDYDAGMPGSKRYHADCAILDIAAGLSDVNCDLGYTQSCRHWQRDLSLEGKNVLAVRLFATSTNAINCSKLSSRDKSCVIYSHDASKDLCLGFSSFATGTNGTNQTDVLQYKVFRDGRNSIYTRDFLSNMKVFAYKTAKTWHDATKTCTNDGGRLVSLETLEKRRRMFDVLDMKLSHYIGLFDSVVESTWMWESGNTFDLSSETNFEFNNYDSVMSDSGRNNADCALSGVNTFLFDVNCDQMHPFICEKDKSD